MEGSPVGRVIEGSAELAERLYEKFVAQAVDREWWPEAGAARGQTTLRKPAAVTGPGTFFGRAQRTLHFLPTTREGWWFDRTDLPESMPIRVSASNVWTTARNIVLCSGSPHNYMRMVEHIIALKWLGLDNVVIQMDSGDPPLFDRGSLDIVEALEGAGFETLDRPVPYVTVREPVTLVDARRGSFLTFLPSETATPSLELDCAVDFPSAIGRQRIRIRLTPETTRYGALARTNCTFLQMLYSYTIGQLFADVRNLGYTPRNILIAGKCRYINTPGLVYEGRSLEAVWHRAVMDLAAALALIDAGCFAGRVLSYRAGHAMDVVMVRQLYARGLLVPVG